MIFAKLLLTAIILFADLAFLTNAVRSLRFWLFQDKDPSCVASNFVTFMVVVFAGGMIWSTTVLFDLLWLVHDHV